MTFNLWTFLFEVLNFLALMYILYRLLYAPLRRAVEERQAAITCAQEEADAARRAAEEAQSQLSAEMSSLQSQRQEVIAQAHAEAEREQQALLARTDEDIRRRTAEAQAETQRQREEALQSLEAELTAEALRVADRLVREASDETLQSHVGERLLDALQAVSPTERARIAAEGRDGAAAILQAPLEPDPGYMERLEDVLTDALGRSVPVSFQVQPELVGMRLRLDGHQWDATLTGLLRDTSDEDERSIAGRP